MYYIRFILTLFILTRLENHLHSATLHQNMKRNVEENLPLITFTPMTRAAECQTGCYMITKQDLLENLESSGIIRVQAYFKDFGNQSGEREYMNEVFEVLKVNFHRRIATMDERKIAEFTVPDFALYRAGTRLVDITDYVKQWLEIHSDEDILHLKIRKKDDVLPVSSYRFAHSERSTPMFIIYSSFDEESSRQANEERSRQARSAEQDADAVSPVCSAANDRTLCCLEPVLVNSSTLQGLFNFQGPGTILINKCSGTCPWTRSESLEDLLFGKQRKCCVKLTASTITLTNYNSTHEVAGYNMQINATHCGCNN